MPRNGSGVYTAPSGTLATPNTTIESTPYNAFVSDVVADANNARPIVSGGTGATSAGAALTALGAGTTGAELFADETPAEAKATLSLGNVDNTTDLLKPVSTATQAAIKGFLHGLTLSNNSTDATNDIDIEEGSCVASLVMPYAGGTMQLDVAYGTGSGGRFDTSISDGTWHCFVISNGTTVGIGMSKSLVPTGEANYPAGYTSYRRVGSIMRESGVIVPFDQIGDVFYIKTLTLDVDTTNPGTSSVTDSLRVPSGIRVMAKFNYAVAYVSNRVTIYFSPLSVVDQSPASLAAAPLGQLRATTSGVGVVDETSIITDTSSSIRYRVDDSDGNVTVRIATVGWTDTRGRIY